MSRRECHLSTRVPSPPSCSLRDKACHPLHYMLEVESEASTSTPNFPSSRLPEDEVRSCQSSNILYSIATPPLGERNPTDDVEVSAPPSSYFRATVPARYGQHN